MGKPVIKLEVDECGFIVSAKNMDDSELKYGKDEQKRMSEGCQSCHKKLVLLEKDQ